MIELEYDTLDLATEARIIWYDYRHRDDNPQAKTVTFHEDVPNDAVIMSLESQPVKFGQSSLTEFEKSRYNWSGRPHGSPNIIEARCVKAAAEFFEVPDWMAHWDPSLTIDENVAIMQQKGTRSLTFEERAKLGKLSYPRQKRPDEQRPEGSKA